ncbi:REP 1 [Rodent stool-associated circular genome virus]|uniref:REP 1 n=1 Tax=Rodent stool-associated circular genome virus TaxID=1074214 RepID=G1C9G8_9VIRU|nr:REP 1 [Rodent stool-associated circular genome virus]
MEYRKAVWGGATSRIRLPLGSAFSRSIRFKHEIACNLKFKWNKYFTISRFRMSEVTMWHRKKGPAKQENKGSKFFLTINYVEAGIETLKSDFQKIRDYMDVACTPNGAIEAVQFWEERGHETGNPHMHGIIMFKRSHRCRCPTVANLLVDTLGIQVRPHIEPLKDLRGAVKYRD